MTPPASTAASAASAGAAARRRTGHGHRAAAPRPARRVSGPTRALRPAPAGPKVRGGSVALPRPRPGTGTDLGARLGAWVRSLPDHRFIERLINGRAWIPLLAFLLCGIVAMQVHLLKLNSGISRAVEKSANLERRNAALRASIGRLSSGEREQAEARRLGLIDPPAGSVRFLRPHRSDAARAAKAMRAPKGTGAATAASASTAATMQTAVPTMTTPSATTATPTTSTPTTSTQGATPTQTTTPTSPGTTTTAPATTVAGATVPGAAVAPGGR